MIFGECCGAFFAARDETGGVTVVSAVFHS